MVEVLVPHVMTDIPRERNSERTGEQINVFFPHVIKEKVEVARWILQEHSQQSTVEEVAEILAPVGKRRGADRGSVTDPGTW